MLEALSIIPEALWSDKIEGFYRMNASQFPGNKASGNKDSFAVYNSAFDGNPPLEQVLVHELAHEKFNYLSDKDRDDYMTATGWFQVNKDRGHEKAKYIRRGCCFVDPDGNTSPDEDFSNNVEYFLFKPETLREKTPAAYQWIKNHFGDSFKMGPRISHDK